MPKSVGVYRHAQPALSWLPAETWPWTTAVSHTHRSSHKWNLAHNRARVCSPGKMCITAVFVKYYYEAYQDMVLLTRKIVASSAHYANKIWQNL